MAESCLNCGHPCGGRFCESCGQRAGLQPITVGGLLRELPKAVFEVDRGLWHTLKGLLLRPGEVINGYFAVFLAVAIPVGVYIYRNGLHLTQLHKD